MKYIFLILTIIGNIAQVLSDEILSYITKDTLTIPYASNIVISSFMSTRADEYVAAGGVSMSLQFSQNILSNLTTTYNVIYFNLTSDQGISCYQQYFNNVPTPAMTVLPCSKNIHESNNEAVCMNLTACYDENFSINYLLSSDEHKQNVLIVENINADNQNQSLSINTTSKVTITSSIGWFYGSVALICILLINLVFLTGVLFFWMLRYKKVKRIYEQFKLTETDYESNEGRQEQMKEE